MLVGCGLFWQVSSIALWWLGMLADGTAPRFHVAEWFTLPEELSLQHLTLVFVDFLTAVCHLRKDTEWGKMNFSHSSASLSCRPYAHIQCSCSNWHHRLRDSGPRTEPGQAAEEWSIVCDSQPSSAGQDGSCEQSLREHVRPHARDLPGDVRYRLLFPTQARKAWGTRESPLCMKSGMTATPLPAVGLQCPPVWLRCWYMIGVEDELRKDKSYLIHWKLSPWTLTSIDKFKQSTFFFFLKSILTWCLSRTSRCCLLLGKQSQGGYKSEANLYNIAKPCLCPET